MSAHLSEEQPVDPVAVSLVDQAQTVFVSLPDLLHCLFKFRFCHALTSFLSRLSMSDTFRRGDLFGVNFHKQSVSELYMFVFAF